MSCRDAINRLSPGLPFAISACCTIYDCELQRRVNCVVVTSRTLPRRLPAPATRVYTIEIFVYCVLCICPSTQAMIPLWLWPVPTAVATRTTYLPRPGLSEWFSCAAPLWWTDGTCILACAVPAQRRHTQPFVFVELVANMRCVCGKYRAWVQGGGGGVCRGCVRHSGGRSRR